MKSLRRNPKNILHLNLRIKTTLYQPKNTPLPRCLTRIPKEMQKNLKITKTSHLIRISLKINRLSWTTMSEAKLFLRQLKSQTKKERSIKYIKWTILYNIMIKSHTLIVSLNSLLPQAQASSLETLIRSIRIRIFCRQTCWSSQDSICLRYVMAMGKTERRSAAI